MRPPGRQNALKELFIEGAEASHALPGLKSKTGKDGGKESGRRLGNLRFGDCAEAAPKAQGLSDGIEHGGLG